MVVVTVGRVSKSTICNSGGTSNLTLVRAVA